MSSYEVTEFGAILLGFSRTHALYVLQFLQGDGIHGRHLLERLVEEDDVGCEPQTLGHLLAQADEHLVELGVEGSHGSLGVVVFVFVLELGVHDHHEGVGRLDEAPS